MARGTWQGSGTWKTTSGGGGGLVLVVIAVVILAASGAASSAVHALEVITIVTGSIIGAAVLGGIGVLVYRARQDHRGRPIAGPRVYQVAPEVRPHLEASSRPALEPPREIHVHIHGVPSPEQAAVIRQAITGGEHHA